MNLNFKRALQELALELNRLPTSNGILELIIKYYHNQLSENFIKKKLLMVTFEKKVFEYIKHSNCRCK